MDKSYFLLAAAEVNGGHIDPALMIKALALANGDSKKGQATYITLRAEELSEDHRKEKISSAISSVVSVAGITATAAVKAVTSDEAKKAAGSLAKVILWLFVCVIVIIAIGAYMSANKQDTTQSTDAPTAYSSGTRTADYPLGTTIQQQNSQYDAMVDQLETQYSPANPKSQNFNRAFVVRMQSQVSANERQGLPGPIALQRAAETLSGIQLHIPPASN